MIRTTPVWLLVTLLGVATAAQEPGLARFEVASVKPHDPSLRPRDSRVIRAFDIRGDALNVMNMPLAYLITKAYGIPEDRIEKLPQWARTASFDILAKAPRAVSKAEIPTMLRDLLSDRFQLRAHLDSRVSDVYFLVRGENIPLGSGLHPVDIDCESNTLNPDSPTGLFPPDARPKCGSAVVELNRYQRNRYAGVTLPGFAPGLSAAVGRPVIDRTGLGGPFDIELTFSSEAALSLVSESARAAAEAAAPTIRDALKEQLGLKVTPGRDSIDFLVVDSLERPTPD